MTDDVKEAIEIIELMTADGRAPVLMVFLAEDGASTLFARGDIDVSEVIRVLAEWDRERCH